MADEAALRLIRPQTPLFHDGHPPLGLDEYQAFTPTTDKSGRPGIEGLPFIFLGLFGEVGSLLSELKKKQRDRDSYVAYHAAAIEELGDALWYFGNAALRAGLRLSGLAGRVPATLGDWDYHGQAGATTFRQLQVEKETFSGPLATDLVERRLLALAGKVGLLVENFTNGRFDANRDALSADLVEILRALIATADDADVSLDEAARRNILKTLDRWPTEQVWGAHYDVDFAEEEQLPRHIAMVFKEHVIGERAYVIQKCRGINIGDRLTDNSIEQDDYRFHDAFHLSYAAILGWSPVLRSLFKVKRKSQPLIDEVQDGARASLIEEGVATLVFNHGMRNQLFRNVETLDYSLLKAVHELVKGYEVDSRPLWQWEQAILKGFEAFRGLCQHRGGTVTADLVSHTIVFEPPLHE